MKPQYEIQSSVDVEAVGCTVLLVSLALIFGFAVPLLLPLVCVSLASHQAVFHLAKLEFGMVMEDKGKPARRYFVISLGLSCILNVAFFFDNSN